MKKIISLLLACLIALCACAQGEPIDSEYFSSFMAEKGFTVENHTENLDQALDFYRGEGEQIKAWGSYFVCFDKYCDEASAKKAITDYKNYYEAMLEIQEGERFYAQKSYLQYKYTDSFEGTQKLFIASQIDSTVITVYARIEYTEAAERLLKELGYGR